MRLHKARISNFVSFYGLTEKEAEVAVNVLDKNLNYGYTKLLKSKSQAIGIDITSQRIREVKSGFKKNLIVFELLIENASENKALAGAAVQSVKKILSE